MLAERLAAVEERLVNACAKAGRRRDEVLLLAVTKVFPVEAMEEAYAAGLREFGENYVQEFEGKFERARQLVEARFHLIGHLQSNKSRRAAEMFDCIHTIDSLKLARRIDEAAVGVKDVYLEVKLSAEETKHGCAPEDLPALVEAVRGLPKLRLRGLMTMPPWDDDAEKARPYFVKLRELGERFGLRELSMGMSNDLEVAIEEGSTLVRVGTALFGSRKPLLEAR
jgi:PLP dependent protein